MSDEIEQEQQQKPPYTVENSPELVQEALRNANWTELTKVQAASMPYMLDGQDVMVQAKTGSGKTGAFILPLTSKIDPLEPACQAMILVPTRELALQVYDEAQMLLKDMGINVVAVYGGVKYRQQINAFEKGAHIIVGTPGRIIDHLSNENLDLSFLQVLVFDEADRMLSMGFYPDMIEIKRYLPQNKPQTTMFSATFPPEVRSLAYQFQTDAEFINLSTDAIHVEEVEHVAYMVDSMDKDRALVRLLEIENPDAAIIFCNTKQRVNYVAVVLGRFGYDADQLTSDLPQKARERVLDRIRDGRLRFLVATDVAARGIDIPHLSHSIQFELPEDLEVYIHRAGRTGRAGARGTAFSLVGGQDEMRLSRLVKQYEIDFDKRSAPTDEEVSGVIKERLAGHLESAVKDRDRMMLERANWYIPLIREALQEGNEQAAMQLGVLLDDVYQQVTAPKREADPKKEAASSASDSEDKSSHYIEPGDRKNKRGSGKRSGNDRKKKGRGIRTKGKRDNRPNKNDRKKSSKS